MDTDTLVFVVAQHVHCKRVQYIHRGNFVEKLGLETIEFIIKITFWFLLANLGDFAIAFVIRMLPKSC